MNENLFSIMKQTRNPDQAQNANQFSRPGSSRNSNQACKWSNTFFDVASAPIVLMAFGGIGVLALVVIALVLLSIVLIRKAHRAGLADKFESPVPVMGKSPISSDDLKEDIGKAVEGTTGPTVDANECD